MRPSPYDVIGAVADIRRIDLRHHVPSCRDHPVSSARALAARVMRTECLMSLPEIAFALRCASHASIHRSLQKFREDPAEVELVAATAHGRAIRRRGLRRNEWPQPAKPVSWLVAADRLLAARGAKGGTIAAMPTDDEIHECIRAACESYAESPGMISLEGLER